MLEPLNRETRGQWPYGLVSDSRDRAMKTVSDVNLVGL